MSRPFDPRRLLQTISPGLGRELFARLYREHGLPRRPRPDPRRFGPALTAPELADAPVVQELLLVLRDVHDLADRRGIAVLDPEVAFDVPARVAEFRAQHARADRALWAYLHAARAFHEAALFARADALSGGAHWQRRAGLPQVALPDDAADPGLRGRLADGLTAFFRTNQGRGRFCHVERYTRANLSEYFFAYLDDYPDSKLVFDDHGAVVRVRQRAAFDVVFAFAAADGVLELYARGGRAVQQPLQQTFCEAVLGHRVDPLGVDDAPYRLDHLVHVGCPLPTRPEDAVAEVRIRRLRLEPLETPRRRIVLEADPKGHPDDVHRMLRRYLDERHLPPENLRVTGASFWLKLAPNTALPVAGQPVERRPKSFSFDVAVPASCNLKGKPEEVRVIGERCLRMWGIARD